MRKVAVGLGIAALVLLLACGVVAVSCKYAAKSMLTGALGLSEDSAQVTARMNRFMSFQLPQTMRTTRCTTMSPPSAPDLSISVVGANGESPSGPDGFDLSVMLVVEPLQSSGRPEAELAARAPLLMDEVVKNNMVGAPTLRAALIGGVRCTARIYQGRDRLTWCFPLLMDGSVVVVGIFARGQNREENAMSVLRSVRLAKPAVGNVEAAR